MESTVQNAQTEIQQKIEEVGDKFRFTSDEILNQIQSNNSGEEQIESLKYEIQSIGEKVEQTSNSVNFNTSENVKDIHTNINTTRDAILSRVSSDISENISMVQDQLSIVQNSIKDTVAGYLNNNTHEINDSIQKILTEIHNREELQNETTNEITHKINEVLDNFKSDIEFSNSGLSASLKDEASKFSSSVDTLIHELEALEVSVKDSASENKIEIINSINAVSNYITNVENDFRTVIANAVNNIDEKLASVPQKIDYAEQSIIQKIDDTKYSNSEQFVSIINKISDLNHIIADKNEDVQNNINYKYNDLKENIQELTNSLNINSKDDFEDINSKLQNINNSIAELTENSSTQNEETLQAISNKLVNLKENIQELTNSLNNGSKDSFEDINLKLQNLSNSLTELSGIQATQNEEALQAISNGLSDLKEKIKNTDSIIYTAKDIVGENTNKLQTIIDSVNNVLNSINETDSNITQAVETELNGLKSAVQALNTSISNDTLSISELIQTRINSIENYLSQIAEKQESQNSETYKNILDSIENLKNISEDSDLRLGESLNKMQSMKDEAIELINNSQELVNDKLQIITDNSNSHFNDLISNIERLKNSLVTRTDWDDKFNDIESSLVNITRDLNLISLKTLTEENLNDLKQEITNTQDELKELVVENSNNKCDIIINELLRHFDNIYKTIDDRINLQDKNINTGIENIASRLNDTNSSISNLINHLDEVKSLITNSDSSDKLDEYLGVIKSEFETVNTAILDSVSQNHSNNNTLSEDLKTKLNEIENSIKASDLEKTESLISMLDKISDSIKDLDKNIDEDTTRQLSIVQDELAAITNTLYSNTEQITSTAKDNLSDIQEKFAHVINLINNMQIEMGQETAANIDTIKNEFNKLNKIFERNDEIKAVLSTLENNLSNSTVQIIEKIQENSSREEMDLCINKLESVENKIDKLEFAGENSENADKMIIANIELLSNKVENIDTNVDDLIKNNIKDQVIDIKNIIQEQQERLEALSTSEEVNRLPHSEDINNLLQQNIAKLLEHFNNKIEKVSNEEIITTQLSQLKSDILAQTVKILDQISFEVEQEEIMDYVQENSNSIKSVISDMKNDLLGQISSNKTDILNTLASKSDITSEFNDIHQKLDDIADNYELQKGFENIQAKLDMVVDNTIEKGFEDVHTRLDSVVDNTIEKGFEEVKSKLDTVADNDELQKEFEEVKKHLLTIQSGDSNANYTYSLQDVETDIAKLRIAMKELQDVSSDEELDDLNKKVDDIVLVVDSIKNQITQADINEIGACVNKITEDIISISTRTNKLLLTSENSANLLKENLDSFRLVIDDLDERTRALAENYDFSRVNQSIALIQKSLIENTSYNNVVNQSLLSIAEWVDYAGSTLTSIVNKIEKIDDIEDVKAMIRSIEKPAQFDYSVFDTIEERFNAQQDKIDLLEDKLNRLTDLVEANDNTQITKKITSVDKQLAKLNKSIERLTSYVDEE